MSIRPNKNAKSQNYSLRLEVAAEECLRLCVLSRKSLQTRASTRVFIRILIGRKTVN